MTNTLSLAEQQRAKATQARLERLVDAVAAPHDSSCDPDEDHGGPARFALVLEPIIGDDDLRIIQDDVMVPCVETFATIDAAARRAAEGYIYDALRPLGVWDLCDGDLFLTFTAAELRARPHYQPGLVTAHVAFEAGKGAIG